MRLGPQRSDKLPNLIGHPPHRPPRSMCQSPHTMTPRTHQTALTAIALFKLVKGLLLLLLGLGLLKLMHAEIATLFSRLIEALHLNADSRIIHALVLKVDALQPQDLAFWLVWA